MYICASEQRRERTRNQQNDGQKKRFEFDKHNNSLVYMYGSYPVCLTVSGMANGLYGLSGMASADVSGKLELRDLYAAF